MAVTPRPKDPRPLKVTPERREQLVAAGRIGNDARLVMSRDDAEALAQVYVLLGRIAKKYELRERLAAAAFADGD